MIRHTDEVLCDRCERALVYEPGMIPDLEGWLRDAGWFVGGIPIGQKTVTHLCPPCYQSLENWLQFQATKSQTQTKTEES